MVLRTICGPLVQPRIFPARYGSVRGDGLGRRLGDIVLVLAWRVAGSACAARGGLAYRAWGSAGLFGSPGAAADRGWCVVAGARAGGGGERQGGGGLRTSGR